MLVLVLLLVVASLGLLIAALTTANTLWAWISVLISVVAAGLLVLDWVRNRRRRSQAVPAAGKARVPATQAVSRSDLPVVGDTTVADILGQESRPLGPAVSRIDLKTVGEQPGASSTSLDEWEHVPELDGPQADAGTNPAEVTATQPPVAEITVTQPPVPVDLTIEPAEENTDATDLLVVSELADEVVVIDERPRYHLAACPWLGDRPTLPLPVSEARELGFTPCALCSPDATLAAQHRARR